MEDRPKTYGQKRERRCATCRAFLSMYNPGDECSSCHPEGRKLYRAGGGQPTKDMLDFQEWTEGINFGAMMEDAA